MKTIILIGATILVIATSAFAIANNNKSTTCPDRPGCICSKTVTECPNIPDCVCKK